MTGRDLYDICCEVIENFDDADLFCIEEDVFQEYSVKDIQEMCDEGFLSFDDKNGIQCFYIKL